MGVSKRLIGAGATASGALTPSENFKVVTYTGTGSAQSITGVGFQPDFVWLKNRSQNSYAPRIFDSSRGATKRLQSSTTAAESTDSTSLTSFDTDGFTLGSDNYVNNSGDNFVAWCWKANGGTTSSNTDGDITSTVQANTDAGFSIVTWTSTSSSSDTIGHGLNSKPDVVLYKKRSSTGSWFWYTDLIDGSWDELILNSTDAKSDFAGTYATSTTFKSVTSSSGADWITYCFHSVDNFSKFGTYTGNGSDDGPIVETGFEPAFIMFKRTDSTGDWRVLDNKRSQTNPRNEVLKPNSSEAEESDSPSLKVDFLSNGFQLKSTHSAGNTNNATYLYMAFAADPDTEAPELASSFNIETYTGTNAAQSITGLGFSPGMVWWKNRSGTNSHALADIVRGANKYIHSDGTQAQNVSNGTSEDCISFDTDGFSIGTVQNAGSINTSGGSIVAWSWKADDNEPTIFGGPAKAVYKFEDNANDVTTNYNGTANSITYATGKFNKAAVFNGTDGDIDLPTDIESSTMAVSLWLYSDVNAPTDKIVIEFENGYGINFNTFASGKIAAQYANANANHTLSNSTISSGQWYHIAANFRSGASDLWVNGVKQTGGTASDYLTSDQNTIGSRRTGQFFDGMIDQVRIYNGNFQQLHVDELYTETASDNDDTLLGGPPETITSVNANAGFSIVKFDGDGSVQTIPHGLSAAPEMILFKNLDSTGDWQVYHTSIGNGNKLSLNSTAASSSTSRFDSTSPTASVFTFNSTSYTGNIIAYCFHSVTGYQKIGSYTGDGNNDRAVTTGFKPDFVMIKSTVGSDNWRIYDTRRGIDAGGYLEPNRSDADDTSNAPNLTMTSTGFTITSGGVTAGNNANGNLYIYWAIAKNVPSNTTLANSFRTITYTGTGSSRSVTGLGFKPDFVWIKNRSSAQSHSLTDSTRGDNLVLQSNETSAEASGQITLDSDGFTIGNGNALRNASGNTYVAWGWKAGNTWQSNVDGTISSLTNVNTANGFSIVKYVGNGVNSATVGHGLGGTPEMIIHRRIDGASGWIVNHKDLDNGKEIYLQRSDAQTDSMGNDGGMPNGTQSSTTLSFQAGASTTNNVNTDGAEYIAYCFRGISGYSKFGTYSGSGSSVSVNTGFQADFVMIKRIDTAPHFWNIFDSVRGGDKRLYPNANSAETDESSDYVTFDSDGFNVDITSNGDLNTSGGTYIYMAFKQNITGMMSFLVIAGGGSGGANSNSGGAGAGGLRTSYGTLSGGGGSPEGDITLSAGTYTITVGGGASAQSFGNNGAAGSDSSIAASGLTTITSTGGGGGSRQGGSAGTGGSGGGGAYDTSGAAGTSGQGYAGGAGTTGGDVPGGGGGGASESGNTDGTGHGGDGLSVSITGSAVTYAGGGSGGVSAGGTQIPGSDGGGGAGAEGNNQAPVAGTTNLGAGGGGGAADTPGAAGGSGVVILRLLTSEYSGTTTGSPTVTTDGDYTVIKYTGSGTYVHS